MLRKRSQACRERTNCRARFGGDRPLVKQSPPNEIHGLQMPLEDQRKISDFIPDVLKLETRGMGSTLSEARVAPESLQGRI